MKVHNLPNFRLNRAWMTLEKFAGIEKGVELKGKNLYEN